VDLQWNASTDANGIAAYDIYRDGTLLDSVGGSTLTYSDGSVSSNTHYSYVVKARDPSNNTSDPSNTADVTTPSIDTVDPGAPGNLATESLIQLLQDRGIECGVDIEQIRVAARWLALRHGAKRHGC